MDKKRAFSLGGATLLLAGYSLGVVPSALPQSAVTAGPAALAAPLSQFPDTPPDTSAFSAVWDRTNSLVVSGRVTRSWYWGPQANFTTRELYVDDPTGTQTRLVQYWDKSRMEVNNPNGNKADPFYVTNGLLTVELISGQMQTGNNTFETRKPANIVIAGDTDDPNAPTYASFASHANAGGDHPDPNKNGQKATATFNPRRRGRQRPQQSERTRHRLRLLRRCDPPQRAQGDVGLPQRPGPGERGRAGRQQADQFTLVLRHGPPHL